MVPMAPGDSVRPAAAQAEDVPNPPGGAGARQEGSDRPVPRRLRILVFNPSYPPVACGVGDYNRGLAAALVRAGHDVTVITAAQIPAEEGGPVRVLALLGNWDVGSFLRAWRQFARPRPDLVVSGFPAV